MYRFGLNSRPDSRRNPARFGQFDRQWQSDFLWWICNPRRSLVSCIRLAWASELVKKLHVGSTHPGQHSQY